MKKYFLIILLFVWFIFINLQNVKADVVFTDVILTGNTTGISPYQNTYNNTWSLGYSWSTVRIAQSFIPRRQRVNSVIIRPSSTVWSMTWNINIAIYVDSGWTVGNNSICTNVITKTMWDSSINQELTVNCQGFFSTMDWTRYWLVLSTDVIWDSSNYYRVSYYGSDVYNWWKFIRYNWTSWIDVWTTDMYFGIVSDYDYLNVINYNYLENAIIAWVFFAWACLLILFFIMNLFYKLIIFPFKKRRFKF